VIRSKYFDVIKSENAYLGTCGALFNCQLRPGSQHSNKGAAEFFEETVNMTRQLVIAPEKILVRLDSADQSWFKSL